jgi:hypothetical protein
VWVGFHKLVYRARSDAQESGRHPLSVDRAV